MCGIVGYVGNRRVVPILLEGLRRLEYRGYDSAGLVYHFANRLVRHRAKGKLANLEAVVDEQIGVASGTGLGHTRWATHGAPTENNAHPHTDCTGELVVVHNGIIENYSALKNELTAKGHVFTSETDTEVLAHLIEDCLKGDLVAAVRAALTRVEGSYAIGVLWAKEPELLVAARNHSPLVMGVTNDSCHIASDIPALLPYTREVIFLDDREMAVLRKGGAYTILSIDDGCPLDKTLSVIDWNASMAEKAGYRHFMLKEIFEQPQAILNTVSGRIVPDTGVVDLPEIGLDPTIVERIERIALVACGTSWHAALIAKYWIEKWAGIPVEVDIASEFRYRRLLVNERVLTIAISQSGETADTLAGIRRAAQLGSRVVTVCNVVGSTMTREADGVIYTHAGPEIGVASTKAFTCQLAALFLLTIYLGQIRKTIDPLVQKKLGAALLECAEVIGTELPRLQAEISTLIERYYEAKDFLFVGRGLNFPVALEGALKLKEISYIHAEGYAAGELKHGPIALIDRDMPVVALAPRDSVYLKTVSNIEEIKARQGRLLLFGTSGDEHLSTLTEDVISLPEVHEDLNPLLYTIPAQLLAYEIANRRGCDVDQPRNLAKSVTVE
ncbi:glutamine--fructose-6-phosphate transaminase [Desulfobulbus propionicus DSM 2032]|jgi:glucosamine--fructose-6-phosphate aminotransferase (isomerizing)|uniref:Glutamine--fructose-6-phosphate aminotransferase [isomerizing] n=1 Tax=Desulfobulbus propionicus (strain ATCC 33891 / DSM 2032 / VKM B-1956 / 1pr3) TaxID=577650 RepID=A0A7U3YLL6_DESPD|nr:glutamine--fructose-6-phosphate transaminase (isomerizing) [Desulfobulbus propionicus]ADW17483.1 glutamine--fructose-6-phosphate transaminase [Desulfobulbus propionicus DSM 2032]